MGLRNFLLLSSIFAMFSCKPRSYNTVHDAGTAATPNIQYDMENISQAPTKDFINGLLDAPGSAARKKAGQILERILARNYPLFPASEYEKSEQELTRKIFGFTVDYLKADAGAACPSNRKVRVYRGFTNLPMIHSPHSPSLMVHLFNDWNAALAKELRISQTSRDPGLEIYNRLDSLKSSAITQLPWAHFLGYKRLKPKARAESETINLEWYSLASGHTVSSNGSPLISTSLFADAIDELKFGPAYLVADVCAERAIPLRSTFAFGEGEVYVPFFILPEEIVRIEGRDCGYNWSAGKSQREQCWKSPLVDPDPRTELTNIYRACYANFGYPVETRYYANSARNAVMRRFADNQDALYNALGTAASAIDMRGNVAALATQCQPSCAVAENVIAGAKNDLAKPPLPSARPEDLENHKKLEQHLKVYLEAMKTHCPALRF